jgi:hypothetical protein
MSAAGNNGENAVKAVCLALKINMAAYLAWQPASAAAAKHQAWQVHRQLARKARYRKVKMAKSNESGVIGANENSESMQRRGEKREEMAKRRQRRTKIWRQRGEWRKAAKTQLSKVKMAYQSGRKPENVSSVWR